MSASGQLQRVRDDPTLPKIGWGKSENSLTVPLLRRVRNICLLVILLILIELEGCMACVLNAAMNTPALLRVVPLFPWITPLLSEYSYLAGHSQCGAGQYRLSRSRTLTGSSFVHLKFWKFQARDTELKEPNSWGMRVKIIPKKDISSQEATDTLVPHFYHRYHYNLTLGAS